MAVAGVVGRILTMPGETSASDVGWFFPLGYLTLLYNLAWWRTAPAKNNHGGKIVMTTRRHFLKGGAAAATGIVFCSCGLLQGAHAQQASRQKLPVMVRGKRIKTIDVHAHCQFVEAAKLLGAAAPSPVRGADEAVIEIDKRLAAMDAQAVDMEVLSINPNWYSRDRELAGQVVKIQNEKL